MCVETVRQYTCGCEELEEVIFCEFLLQPGNGHYANGQKTGLDVVLVEMYQECEECAALAEKLMIAQAKAASMRGSGSSGTDGKTETAVAGATKAVTSNEGGGEEGARGWGQAVARHGGRDEW